MTVMGLDLGRTMGFAVGPPNIVPRSCSVKLAKPGQDRSVVFANLVAFLDTEFRREKPSIVVKEAPLALQAFKQLNMGEPVVRMTYGLHAIVEGLCGRFGVRWRDEADSRVRLHFIGKGRLGTREATKAAVVKRCHLLGYLPADCHDDNRADALAAWDFAVAHYARQPSALRLFGDAA